MATPIKPTTKPTGTPQKPGEKPQKPGIYEEVKPVVRPVTNPRVIHVRPGDGHLPPTPKPGHLWQPIKRK